MTDRDRYLDARLSELLSDAVSEIEPGDRLASIRNETRVTPMSARRPWIYAVGGAVAATAAVITAVAFAGDNLGLTGSDGSGPAAPSPSSVHSRATDPSETPSEQPTSSSAPAPQKVALAVYFAGETPHGLRLYREFQQATTSDAPTTAADLAVSGAAVDPDYRSTWPAGTHVASATYDGDVITVNVESADAATTGLHDRPAGMSEADASIAVQQVIYTVQAAVQDGRPGVQFLLDGERTDQVLGVPTSEPLAEAPQTDVLSLMSITSPAEGDPVSGTFTASGVGSSFEANVQWQVKQGDTVVKKGFTTAEGWMDKLYPWKTEAIDVSDLAPGDYTFVALTDDPSGGAEGSGPDVDTRTITVE